MFEKTKKNEIKRASGLSLLRQFYHTYGKRQPQSQSKIEQECRYHRKKTDSAVKISQFLNSMSGNHANYTTISNNINTN